MYCAEDTISLGAVPVSNPHHFTLSLFVFIGKKLPREGKKKSVS